MLLCCPLPGYLDWISASRSLIRLPNNLLRQADHRIQTGNKHKPQMTWKHLCRLQPQTCRVLNTLLIVFNQEIHTHTKEHAHLVHRPKFRSLFEPHSCIFQTAVLNIFTWLIWTTLFWKQFNPPPKTLKQLVLFVGHFSNHVSKAFYVFSIHPGKKKIFFNLSSWRKKRQRLLVKATISFSLLFLS